MVRLETGTTNMESEAERAGALPVVPMADSHICRVELLEPIKTLDERVLIREVIRPARASDSCLTVDEANMNEAKAVLAPINPREAEGENRIDSEEDRGNAASLDVANSMESDDVGFLRFERLRPEARLRIMETEAERG